jgi:hypothetical protein
MQLPNSNSDTIALIGRVYDEAWLELQGKSYFRSDADKTGARTAIATRIMAAVAVGERDPERLKLMALQAATLNFPAEGSVRVVAAARPC